MESDNKTRTTSKSKLARDEGWISIVVNTLLFILKYWAGMVTGSVAIIADAWHTLSDSLSSLIVLIGAKVSSKPPDREHPFGHGRAELIASVLIAAFLGFVAFEFLKESILKLNNREIVVFGKIAIIATIISIVLKEALSQYAFWAWKKTGYLSLKADAWHHRTDAISSLIILVGIFLGRYFWWMDGVLGIIVAVMIAYAGYEILKDTISKLLGEAPDPALVKQIKEIAGTQSEHDMQIHHIHVHSYGEHQEITFHIRLPNTMSVEDSHTLVTAIQTSIRSALSIEATIHVEPRERG
ncbi:MAG: cation transporter [Bacteroidales bacterium]|nr:cation transporter [Bacteroidales bacterium]